MHLNFITTRRQESSPALCVYAHGGIHCFLTDRVLFKPRRFSIRDEWIQTFYLALGYSWCIHQAHHHHYPSCPGYLLSSKKAMFKHRGDCMHTYTVYVSYLGEEGRIKGRTSSGKLITSSVPEGITWWLGWVPYTHHQNVPFWCLSCLRQALMMKYIMSKPYILSLLKYLQPYILSSDWCSQENTICEGLLSLELGLPWPSTFSSIIFPSKFLHFSRSFTHRQAEKEICAYTSELVVVSVGTQDFITGLAK